MQITEVTQEQWKKVMGNDNNPSFYKGNNLPIDNVSWNMTQKFIKKLNKKEGTDRYRLPTEAEWEYACRAGTETAYYWGPEMNDEYCWNYDNSDDKTHPVGTKKPNAWGLYDMLGNVWEWCEDWYAEQFYNREEAKKDPCNKSFRKNETLMKMEIRVLRGGSCSNDSMSCRSAYRDGSIPELAGVRCGFRLVWTSE
jgi:formylglycine-generating enzyme required for sulfatase activity